MKPPMNTDEPGTAWPQPKKRAHELICPQVWSPAFRLPWVRSRLKPELRTSPQRRGGRLWERRYPVHHEDTKTRRIAKDFFASSCFRGEIFWLRRGCSVFSCVHLWFSFMFLVATKPKLRLRSRRRWGLRSAQSGRVA